MDVNYNGVKLDVSFTYYPAQTGCKDSWGAPLEPDEDATIDIDSVTLEGKDVTELCDAAGIMGDIEALVWADMNDQDYGGNDD